VALERKMQLKDPYEDLMYNIMLWIDFQKADLRVGTIVEDNDFPEALNSAYILKVDFGDEIVVNKSSEKGNVALAVPELEVPNGTSYPMKKVR